MANKETENCEKFKTMIGGQALIEGIMYLVSQPGSGSEYAVDGQGMPLT